MAWLVWMSKIYRRVTITMHTSMRWIIYPSCALMGWNLISLSLQCAMEKWWLLSQTWVIFARYLAWCPPGSTLLTRDTEKILDMPNISHLHARYMTCQIVTCQARNKPFYWNDGICNVCDLLRRIPEIGLVFSRYLLGIWNASFPYSRLILALYQVLPYSFDVSGIYQVYSR